MPDYIIMKVKRNPETNEIDKMKVRQVEIRDKHVYREMNGGKSIEYSIKQIVHKMINGDQFFTLSKSDSSPFSRKIGTKLEYFIRPLANGMEHTLDQTPEYK